MYIRAAFKGIHCLIKVHRLFYMILKILLALSDFLDMPDGDIHIFLIDSSELTDDSFPLIDGNKHPWSCLYYQDILQVHTGYF